MSVKMLFCQAQFVFLRPMTQMWVSKRCGLSRGLGASRFRKPHGGSGNTHHQIALTELLKLQKSGQFPVLDNVTSIKYLSKTDSRIRNKGRTLRRNELVDCVRGLG